MADTNRNLFQRLTRLFRSGPVIKRSVINPDENYTSSAFDTFRKNQSAVYSAAMSAYGTYDRMSRYSDFSEMEYTPEIASALDIYSEESIAADENGNTLHIYSENTKIRQILTELFYDTLNIEFNISAWVRNLCKYGDFFLFNDVDPKYGVINAYPLPISEVEREEGYDKNDPLAVRFRWVTQGNQVLENWQVSHMRLLANDAFLPYGSSVLEPARRIWRQLILLEDAMLVYRVVRAPERRVFKIDVGNVPPEDIPNYMEQVQSSLKRASIVDKNSGRVDLRYNPLSVDEDYFLPVRGGESGTDIITLAGGQIAGETSDVEYIQKKLFAALKIPKAYLGYDEGLGAKATLSQEDIRFSRTIARIQRTILSELNKIAIVHLYCHGYSSEDLLDFDLKLSNPSTIAQQQKIELFRTRFEAAQSALAVPGLIDRKWVQKNILKLSDEEIKSIKEGLRDDKASDLAIESIQLEQPQQDMSGQEPDMGEEPTGDIDLDDLGGDEPGAAAEPLAEENLIEDENFPIKVQDMIQRSIDVLSEEKIDEDKEDDDNLSEFEKWQKEKSSEYRTKRKKKKRKQDLELPDDMTSLFNPGNKARKSDVSGMKRNKDDLKLAGKFLNEEDFDITEYLDKQIDYNVKMTNSIKSTLNRFDAQFGKPENNVRVIISEKNSSEEGKND